MRMTEWDRLKSELESTQQQLDMLARRVAEAEVRRVLARWVVLDDCGPC